MEKKLPRNFDEEEELCCPPLRDTTPEYIANSKQPPHHRGNTHATGYDRPWFGPVDDAERALMLAQLEGALLAPLLIAKQLGMATDDYETSLKCIKERVTAERRTLAEGCKS